MTSSAQGSTDDSEIKFECLVNGTVVGTFEIPKSRGGSITHNVNATFSHPDDGIVLSDSVTLQVGGEGVEAVEQPRHRGTAMPEATAYSVGMPMRVRSPAEPA